MSRRKWVLVICGVIIAVAYGVIYALVSASTAPSSAPTPTVIVPTTVTPTPTPSTPAVTPSASTTSTEPTPSPSATASNPGGVTPVSCKIGQPDGIKSLGQCLITGYTAAQVLDVCRSAANESMWQVTNGELGAELPVSKVERYITICLNGAGLSYQISSPMVAGYPDGKTLRYILIQGGFGPSGKLEDQSFLYDAITGKAIDDDTLKAKVWAWNSRGIG